MKQKLKSAARRGLGPGLRWIDAKLQGIEARLDMLAAAQAEVAVVALAQDERRIETDEVVARALSRHRLALEAMEAGQARQAAELTRLVTTLSGGDRPLDVAIPAFLGRHLASELSAVTLVADRVTAAEASLVASGLAVSVAAPSDLIAGDVVVVIIGRPGDLDRVPLTAPQVVAAVEVGAADELAELAARFDGRSIDAVALVAADAGGRPVLLAEKLEAPAGWDGGLVLVAGSPR